MATVAGTRAAERPRTTSERLVRFLNKSPIHIALAFIALVWLAPTVGLLVTSFRPRSDIQVTGWWESFLQFRYTLENYEQVLTAQGMLEAFWNTLLIAVPSTLIPLVLASMAAYAFSWLSFPFRDGLFLIVIALLMIPAQVTFIPLLKLFAPTGLLNSFGAIWLIHTAFALPFGIFLLRNFFITLPKDLIEAARIDGSSTIGIFRTIVVPLSVPAIAAYGIFQFLWVWNDLLMALVFVQRGDMWPMTKAVQNLLTQYGTEWHLLAAGAFILMAVPLLVFFSLQRYFVQGLLAGSVK
ncbi:MAG TPA: carbohydrate ABC transporter permease [Candidatus Limnocylindrales bacterium]